MILQYNLGNLQKVNNYREAFQLVGMPSQVVSFVGGGGKTTTIRRLAKTYWEEGIPVVVTTTTHMRYEDVPYMLLEESIEKLIELLDVYGKCVVGNATDRKTADGTSKFCSTSESFFEEICQEMERRGGVVLVEADGAKELPCKVPEEWEPVIPKQTTQVVAVYGLDAIGKTFAETCFRAELAAEVLHKKIEDKVTTDDIVCLAVSELGSRKSVGNKKLHLLLNKADSDERIAYALQICKKIDTMSEKPENILITGYDLYESR